MGSKYYKFIALSKDNYSHLKQLGSFGDSFNDIITKLLSARKLELVKIE